MADKLPDSIPVNQFVPDQAPQAMSQEGAALPDVIPVDQFVSDEQTYGSPIQQARAGVAGALRGVTLGGSDVALRALGADPEKLRLLNETNPMTSAAGQLIGGAALIYGTGGLAAPVEAGLARAGVNALAARTGAFALEGAVFGGGNVVTDLALGDPRLNGERILAEVGLGAALGGGLGLLSKGLELPGAMRRMFGKTYTPGEPPISPGAIHEAPFESGKPIQNYDDLIARTEQARKEGKLFELPEKPIVVEAHSRLGDLEVPVLPQQINSLDSQQLRTDYKILRESDSKVGQAIQDLEAMQKREYIGKIDETINSLAPESIPTGDAMKGGQRAIDAFTSQYQTEQKALAPAFNALKKINLKQMNTDPADIIIQLADSPKGSPGLPAILKMFEIGDGGAGVTGGVINKVLPYSTRWGIDKSTYTATKELFEGLQGLKGEKTATLQDLLNIRKGLDQHVDVLAQGKGPGEIRLLKAKMMDIIQHELDAAGAFPELFDIAAGLDAKELRDIFKRYAINENRREVIEDVFGASVGKKEFGQISKVKPEVVLDKIFRDSATTKAAKDILDPKTFDDLLAHHLAEQRALSTADGHFSSKKFGKYLDNNKPQLDIAFGGNEAKLQRIKDLNTVTRILPDSVSVNPSGTAKTLIGMLSNIGPAFDIGMLAHFSPESILAWGGKKAVEKLMAIGKERGQRAAWERLGGEANKASGMIETQKILNKIDNKITVGVESIFGTRERTKKEKK